MSVLWSVHSEAAQVTAGHTRCHCVVPDVVSALHCLHVPYSTVTLIIITLYGAFDSDAYAAGFTRV
jgi:hypothetical protein